ncbi:MAG: NAD(+)/NADH kinase [Kiritimatiellae bacterium]|nr:NAD(+)/NADH kinase [Kiritimatiellia bacterium]
MRTLGIIANCGKERVVDVLGKLAIKADELGLELIADEVTAGLLKVGEQASLDVIFDSVDAIVALGGDGTMLRVVRAMAGRDKPVMGVNIGSLGFLTSVAEDELDRALDCLAGDNYVESVRAIAECVVISDAKETAIYRALNEVLVSQGPSSRVVTLGVSIDGDDLTSYVCDGLIVSTPTGSTGHSLSAGGPILTPGTPAFVISVICPHTLSSRPIVVPDSSEIEIVSEGEPTELLLSVDGQVGQVLKAGDRVKITRSKKSVRLIHMPGHSYFSVLSQKLRWSGTLRPSS